MLIVCVAEMEGCFSSSAICWGKKVKAVYKYATVCVVVSSEIKFQTEACYVQFHMHLTRVLQLALPKAT